MTRLKWGEGPPMYDLGVDHGVLYLDNTAVPWNGLVSVDEKESGLVDVEHYFDGNRIHISQELGDFEASISAYTYPDAFNEYNGYGPKETYKRFGFSYRTQHGESYKIHLVYNVLVRHDSWSWVTESNVVTPSTFNWDIYGAPVLTPGASPAAHLTIEAPRDPSVIESIEDILYGTADTEPRLPDPEELIELYEAATILRITYNGDGTYTATGPDDMVVLLPDGRFQINAPSAFLIDEDKFVVHSY
jgi:hypothetical protein